MRAIVALILVLLTAAPAAGDEAADRQEARRAFAAGQAAESQRDWQTAIDHYLRANDLVPHPNTMFNIATAYERLGKLREAAVWYQRYIDAAPDSPDRDRVIRQLRELQNRPGTITVRSIPNGARVSIDRKEVGVTPYSGHIKGGRHVVAVEHDGMREERAVTIAFGEPAILDVTLRGAAGTLRVIGSPPGSLVTVDSAPAGAVPVEIPLAPGVHAVQVSQVGYQPYDTSVTIEPNRIAVVRARLTRSLGTFGETKPRTIKIGYLFGAWGGIDARGDGGLALIELGVRATQFDASIRIGKTAGHTAIDFLARWTVTKGKLAPFATVGYTIIADDTSSEGAQTGSGYLLTGGLRYDVTRGDRYVMSVCAESGIRAYQVSGAVDVTDRESVLIVPVMTSLLISYQ